MLLYYQSIATAETHYARNYWTYNDNEERIARTGDKWNSNYFEFADYKKLEMKHGIGDKCNNFMPKTSNNLKSFKKAMKHGVY